MDIDLDLIPRPGEVSSPGLAWAFFTRPEGGMVSLGPGGQLYRYHDGVWRPDGAEHVGAFLQLAHGPAITPSLISGTLKVLREGYVTIGHEANTQYLNVANGLLDWRTGEMSEHSPTFATPVQIPWPWIKGARCPRIDAFLDSLFSPALKQLVLEMFGYALLPDMSLQRMFLLFGQGGNGKSQLLTLLMGLVGANNCSFETLQSLTENKFASSELHGKLVNIADDLDARAVKRTDTIKMLSGGGKVRAERKGRDAFYFTSYALPVFSANEQPYTSDQTDAWFDRWIIIPFERKIRGSGEEVPDIGRSLVADEAEMAGLLYQSVRALWTLMERGHFELPAEVLRANEEYEANLDSVKSFLDDRCRVSPELECERGYFYQSYREHCGMTGRPAVKDRVFATRLKRHLPYLGTRKSTNHRFWTGVGLTSALSSMPGEGT